jgi:hypothetical protein
MSLQLRETQRSHGTRTPAQTVTVSEA